MGTCKVERDHVRYERLVDREIENLTTKYGKKIDRPTFWTVNNCSYSDNETPKQYYPRINILTRKLNEK